MAVPSESQPKVSEKQQQRFCCHEVLIDLRPRLRAGPFLTDGSPAPLDVEAAMAVVRGLAIRPYASHHHSSGINSCCPEDHQCTRGSSTESGSNSSCGSGSGGAECGTAHFHLHLRLEAAGVPISHRAMVGIVEGIKHVVFGQLTREALLLGMAKRHAEGTVGDDEGAAHGGTCCCAVDTSSEPSSSSSSLITFRHRHTAATAVWDAINVAGCGLSAAAVEVLLLGAVQGVPEVLEEALLIMDDDVEEAQRRREEDEEGSEVKGSLSPLRTLDTLFLNPIPHTTVVGARIRRLDLSHNAPSLAAPNDLMMAAQILEHGCAFGGRVPIVSSIYLRGYRSGGLPQAALLSIFKCCTDLIDLGGGSEGSSNANSNDDEVTTLVQWTDAAVNKAIDAERRSGGISSSSSSSTSFALAVRRLLLAHCSNRCAVVVTDGIVLRFEEGDEETAAEAEPSVVVAPSSTVEEGDASDAASLPPLTIADHTAHGADVFAGGRAEPHDYDENAAGCMNGGSAPPHRAGSVDADGRSSVAANLYASPPHPCDRTAMGGAFVHPNDDAYGNDEDCGASPLLFAPYAPHNASSASCVNTSVNCGNGVAEEAEEGAEEKVGESNVAASVVDEGDGRVAACEAAEEEEAVVEIPPPPIAVNHQVAASPPLEGTSSALLLDDLSPLTVRSRSEEGGGSSAGDIAAEEEEYVGGWEEPAVVAADDVAMLMPVRRTELDAVCGGLFSSVDPNKEGGEVAEADVVGAELADQSLRHASSSPSSSSQRQHPSKAENTMASGALSMTPMATADAVALMCGGFGLTSTLPQSRSTADADAAPAPSLAQQPSQSALSDVPVAQSPLAKTAMLPATPPPLSPRKGVEKVAAGAIVVTSSDPPLVVPYATAASSPSTNSVACRVSPQTIMFATPKTSTPAAGTSASGAGSVPPRSVSPSSSPSSHTTCMNVAAEGPSISPKTTSPSEIVVFASVRGGRGRMSSPSAASRANSPQPQQHSGAAVASRSVSPSAVAPSSSLQHSQRNSIGIGGSTSNSGARVLSSPSLSTVVGGVSTKACVVAVATPQTRSAVGWGRDGAAGLSAAAHTSREATAFSSTSVSPLASAALAALLPPTRAKGGDNTPVAAGKDDGIIPTTIGLTALKQ